MPAAPATADAAPARSPVDPSRPTQNVNVASFTPLISPGELERELPAPEESVRTVVEGREAIRRVLRGEDDRLLVVLGPCSIHDVKAATEYAQRLSELSRRYENRAVLVMRVYFEKPRTTLGWKGLINDPHLDGSFDMATGLRRARQLLIDITRLGLCAGTEFLDPITPQYLDDLVSWAAIGARTTESQTHRQMASGLSMPVGFKNATNGEVQVAIDAMRAARSPHHFVGIDEAGKTCVVATRGNRDGHLILRGGKDAPNYDPANVADAAGQLDAAGLHPALMVDCSHANSGKRHEEQEVVWRNLLDQRNGHGASAIVGAMLESNLGEGSQKLGDDPSHLRYGVSITDACIGWEKTDELLAMV